MVHRLKTPNSTPGDRQGTEFAMDANVRSWPIVLQKYFEHLVAQY
jgi:hypothetical protein